MGSEAETTADLIRELAEAVDHASNWRVLVPYRVFHDVEDCLDADRNGEVGYRGVTLCYTDHYDEARAEMRAPLENYVGSLQEADDAG